MALEVNGLPDRLDLRDVYVRQAVERGVKIVCSTDAHSIRGLGNMELSVATARRGWATAADVLNTRPLDSVLVDDRAPTVARAALAAQLHPKLVDHPQRGGVARARVGDDLVGTELRERVSIAARPASVAIPAPRAAAATTQPTSYSSAATPSIPGPA